MSDNYISCKFQSIYPNVANSNCSEKEENVSTLLITSQIQINKVNNENPDSAIVKLISSLKPKQDSNGYFKKFNDFYLSQRIAPFIFDVVNKRIQHEISNNTSQFMPGHPEIVTNFEKTQDGGVIIHQVAKYYDYFDYTKKDIKELITSNKEYELPFVEVDCIVKFSSLVIPEKIDNYIKFDKSDSNLKNVFDDRSIKDRIVDFIINLF